MADAIRLPAAPGGEPLDDEEPTPLPAVRLPADSGGWPLLLVPAGICLVMFLVAAWW